VSLATQPQAALADPAGRARPLRGRLAGRIQLVAQAGVLAVVVVFGDDERALDLDGQRAVEAQRPAEGGEVLGDMVAVSGDSTPSTSVRIVRARSGE
jgi:hypothetical protein